MEKRQHPRASKIFLAKVKSFSGEFLAYILDLATNGVGFTTNCRLSVGDVIEIAMNVPNQPTFIIRTKIVWHRELPEFAKGKYLYGAILVDFPEEYERLVDSLIPLDC